MIKNNTTIFIQATGGKGGTVKSGTGIAGDGGTPNGKKGTNSSTTAVQGGIGFDLSFILKNGIYGQGGGTQGGVSTSNAGGGSGGYNSNYINVNANTTYSVTVGAGGSKVGGSKSYNGNSGFILIAYGQGIE